MADVNSFVPNIGGTNSLSGNGVTEKWRDAGDGTWQKLGAMVVVGSDGTAGGSVTGFTAIVGASFSRPADTSAYAIGDIIGDSTVAATMNANVTAASAGIMRVHVARATDKTGMVRRLRLKTTDAAFLNMVVRVHLFRDRPTLLVGDNGAFAANASESNYLGYGDITLAMQFSDYVKGITGPADGSEWNFDPFSGTDYIHALLECRSVVTPGSAKTWSLVAEVLQN